MHTWGWKFPPPPGIELGPPDKKSSALPTEILRLHKFFFYLTPQILNNDTSNGYNYQPKSNAAILTYTLHFKSHIAGKFRFWTQTFH